MKSVVEVEINAPQAKVAELFADPRMFPEWMEDVARIEPLGKVSPASVETEYRLVPKKGNLAFVARVIRREPPYRSRLAMLLIATKAVSGCTARLSNVISSIAALVDPTTCSRRAL